MILCTGKHLVKSDHLGNYSGKSWYITIFGIKINFFYLKCAVGGVQLFFFCQFLLVFFEKYFKEFLSCDFIAK